uniref:Uncharacterized protein n=1 Tax=Anopheles atroparvus TaxID=41427 RepID=A0AAG5DLC2_ANOAO
MCNVPPKFYTLCRLCLTTIRDCDLPESTVNFREQPEPTASLRHHRQQRHRNGHLQPQTHHLHEQQQPLPIVECNVEIICAEDEVAGSTGTPEVTVTTESDTGGGGGGGGVGGDDAGDGYGSAMEVDGEGQLGEPAAASKDDQASALPAVVTAAANGYVEPAEDDEDYDDDDVFSAGNMCPDLPKRIWTCLSIKVCFELNRPANMTLVISEKP